MKIFNATLTDFNTLRFKIDDLNQFIIPKFIVKNGSKQIAILCYYICNNSVTFTLSENIDIKYYSYISYENLQERINYYDLFCSEKFDEKYYFSGELGALYRTSETEFRVWTPVATNVNILLYKNGDPLIHEEPKRIPLKESNGLWSVAIKENLDGYFYNYEVTAYENTNEAVDPYAKAVGINGLRGAIISRKNTNPEGFILDSSPNTIKHYTDAIIYEVSIRDISSFPSSGIVNKGKFLGLTEENTVSDKNISTGLSHIKEMGITHIQIMPMFDFSHKSVDEKNPSASYNWGYDPQNYNVPDGSYSTNPYDPYCRIKELKTMIMTLHKNNICVNMDVVYNHMIKIDESNFHRIFPGYYFRYFENGTFCNGSGCSNDTASEHKMMRKFILDSVLYWAKEYHIDGFRFDLMGIHDIETMNLLRTELNKIGRTIMLYGEGWDLNTNLPIEIRAMKANATQTPELGYFNDVIRDAIRGSVFIKEDPGFISGKNGLENIMRTCICGCIDGIFSEPEQAINYISCHDNNTLWDKISLSNPRDSILDRESMLRLGASILLTCQGIPFIHSGMEFCRTKNGISDSYNSPDSINWMDWDRKADYGKNVQYIRELIQLRKNHPAFRFHLANEIKHNIEFINDTPQNTVAYILKNKPNNDTWSNIIVIYNANKTTQWFKLPEGTWNLVANKFSINEKGIKNVASYLEVEGISMNILYR